MSEILKDKNIQVNELLSGLNQKIGSNNDNGYSYEIQRYYDGKIEYNAIFMGETLDVQLDTPEELIDMLKLINKIISIYQENKLNPKKNGFYTKLWKAGRDKNDLVIDNRKWIPDTVILSQEGLAKILNEDENKRLNKYMDKLTIFLNQIIDKI